MTLKVSLILSGLLLGLIVAVPLCGGEHELDAVGFESSGVIEFENPYVEKASVYKGQLHCHTTNSDGVQSPLEVVEAYKNAGYDFMAITDHDYVTPDQGVEGILFITGNEVSSTLGHITTINVSSIAPSRKAQEVVDWTKNQGGLVWLAHPNYDDNFGWTIREISSVTEYHGIEVYNSKANSYADDKWDYILTYLDKKITATAVDDCHDIEDPKQFNGCWVMVFADSLTKTEILDSLEKGNFYSTQGPIINAVETEGNTINIKLKQTSKVTWIGAGGSILQETTAVKEDTYVVQGNEKYVRIRVESSGYAWTNPIYISELTIQSVSVSDSRVNPAQLITISGQIYNKDTINPPASNVSALQFKSDSYVWVNRSESLEPTEMSFALWVKFDGYDTDKHQTLISKRDSDSGYFVLWNATSQMIEFYAFTDKWRYVAASPPAIGEWCHITGTYTALAGKLSLYINGSLANEATIEKGGILHSLTELTIGAFNPSYLPTACGVNGTIDEVVLDNRTWSQAEAKFTYEGLYPKGTVLYLPFDGDTQDYSGETNHGKTYNATWTGGRKVNLQVYIELDGENKATLSTIEADGTFTFPTFSVETAIGSFNYNVYMVSGKQISVQNQSVSVIVDGLKVTKHVTNGSSDQVQVRILYAYDDEVVKNGNTTYAGLFELTNANGWAKFNLSSVSTVEWGSIAYAISEPKYNLTAKIQNQTVSYAKTTIATFTIKADSPILNAEWNIINSELSFNSSGTIVTDVGNLGKPIRIEVDGTTYTDWTYNSTSQQVTANNIHGKIVLQWTSNVTELWIIAAFFAGLTMITAVILLKKRNITSFFNKAASQ